MIPYDFERLPRPRLERPAMCSLFGSDKKSLAPQKLYILHSTMNKSTRKAKVSTGLINNPLSQSSIAPIKHYVVVEKVVEEPSSDDYSDDEEDQSLIESSDSSESEETCEESDENEGEMKKTPNSVNYSVYFVSQ